MYLAAVEHRIRRGVAAIDRVAEELAGFFFGTPDYERGVSPAHAAARRTVMDRAEQQRCEFVEREAEEDVLGPYVPSSTMWNPATRKAVEDAYWCFAHDTTRMACKDKPHQSSAHAGADTASAGTPAAEAAPAGVSTSPHVPPAGLNFTDWATPEIRHVLAEHHYRLSAEACDCGGLDGQRPVDPSEWREHVAPLIVERLEKGPR